MIHFLKENGFPMSLFVETDSEYVNDEGDNCLKTTITDENGKLIWEFEHKDLRARIHWVSGFYTALRMQNKKCEEKFQTYFNDIPNGLSSVDCNCYIKNMLKESSDGNEGKI
jgi:hypothetical protein